MRTPRSTMWLIAVAAVAMVIGVAKIGIALHFQTPPFVNVSSQASGDIGEISSRVPSWWAFNSSGDVMGNGNASPQIFYYDHEERVLAQQFGITQITCGPDNASDPSISQDGTLVAFEADGGLCLDGRHNCDGLQTPVPGRRQIFVFNHESGRISQVTNCPDAGCTNPYLSHNGKMLLFESLTEIVGGGPAGAVTYLFQGDLRRIGQGCRQFPCGIGPATGVELITKYGGRNGVQNRSGRFVAFESTGDPVNQGANPGVSRIYVKDMKLERLAAISNDVDDAQNPAMNGAGYIVAYDQDTPNGAGKVKQIHIVRTRLQKKTVVVKSHVQVTNGTADSFGAVMDPTGRRLAFISAADLKELGRPGNQLYVYDSSRRKLQQVTAGPNGASFPAMTGGVFVGFRSTDDFTGTGSTTPQFYIANLFKNAPGSIPSPKPTATRSPLATVTQTPGPPPSPTSTATPIPGVPANIGLALLAAEAGDNGDDTLTTLIAATVADHFGNPVPDGTQVNFALTPGEEGIVVHNGLTNVDPNCDVASFIAKTGLTITNRPGVVHTCLTFVHALQGTRHTIFANSGNGAAFGFGEFVLPLESNSCSVLGQPCSDFNSCTDNDVCATGSGFECRGGTSAHAECTSDVDCPDLMVCSGGSQNGSQCADASECPDLRKCLGGDNHNAPCTTEFDCPGGSCALFSTGLCTLVNDGSCQPTAPLVCQPGTIRSCSDDLNPCTEDVCNFATGVCGKEKFCPYDDNECTDDVCDIATGLCGIPNADPCTADDNVCTDDVCDGTSGTCTHLPNSAPCQDDANPCTDDICDGTTGSCGVPNTAPCDDTNLCTLGDVCAAGACVPGPVMTCPPDGNSCTLDECDPSNGQCYIRFDPCACSAP